MSVKVGRVMTQIGGSVTQIIKAGATRQIIVVPDEGLKRAIFGSIAYGVIKGTVTSVVVVR